MQNTQQNQQTQKEQSIKLEIPLSMVNTVMAALQNVDAPHRVTDPVLRLIAEQAKQQVNNEPVSRDLPGSNNTLN